MLHFLWQSVQEQAVVVGVYAVLGWANDRIGRESDDNSNGRKNNERLIGCVLRASRE
jgi:hypothetical protein